MKIKIYLEFNKSKHTKNQIWGMGKKSIRGKFIVIKAFFFFKEKEYRLKINEQSIQLGKME